jgi:hypothetical protein
MLLSMFGFVAGLLVIGGLATLVVVGDPLNSRLAPYIGFVALFAGLGALSLSVILTVIGGLIFRSESLAGLGLFVGYILGGLGGAAFGFYRAIERREIEHSDVQQ